MNSCPMGQLTIEQVTNQLHFVGALFYEKITDSTIINNIINKLAEANPGMEVLTDSDMYILFMSSSQSYLAEFVQGCSRVFYSFNYESTVNFLNFLNGAPL
jgi:hypothetical protein